MIRKGLPKDLSEICAIERLSFRNPWTPGQLASEMKYSCSLVEEEGGGIIGYLFFRVAADEMEVTNIAVSPQKRRQGVAGNLLRKAMEETREHGAEKVFLDVRHTNSAARLLYESLGFRETGARKDYYGKGEDAIVMVREV